VRAEEMNRRFARATGTVRLRTSRLAEPIAAPDRGVDGVLRAFVSPGYSAVADSRVARMLLEALSAHGEHDFRLIRIDLTTRSVSYVVRIGEPYQKGQGGNVGEVWGGILIKNSGVGFASLVIVMHLTRLVCLNGMVAPLPDAVLLRRRHRGIEDGALRGLLGEKLVDLPDRLHHGQRRLVAAEGHVVEDVEAEIRALLRTRALPQKLLPAILDAYRKEPRATAFGVSQALTLAAQGFAPEERLELEEAAGAYLAEVAS
jgi:hypothetical protein